MSIRSVICIAHSIHHANQIVGKLIAEHFSSREISALFADKLSGQDFAQEKTTQAPDGAITDDRIERVVDGALGWIAGISALAIPGVVPCVATGPTIAALSGVASTSTMGGVAKRLVGIGIPEQKANFYESKLLKGNILISVQSKNFQTIERATEIFENTSGEDIITIIDAPSNNRFNSLINESEDALAH